MIIEDIHALFLQCKSICIDTRKIESKSMFFALKGERFDANQFANEALERGASFVIIDDKKHYIDERTIVVENSLETLQLLAKYHRRHLNIPIISLTGSNGKTTTKELINVVLSKNFKTKATIGNLNNHIGVPLTILSFTKETEIGIIEMGANHQKEIEFLCNIAEPNYGYITNFGKAHLEGFGGIEGVIIGKSEMYHYIKKNKLTVFVNLDDEIQNHKTEELNRITFSKNDKRADLFINEVTANPFVTVNTIGVKINTHLIGLYNANNICAAIIIGKHFGVDINEIKIAIESYIPENNRSQLLSKNSNEIILDAYNANPSSMSVAIENFMQLNKQNKIIIIGDMFELGDESLKEHKAIVLKLLNENNIECHFVGNNFYSNKTEKANFNFYKTFEELSNYFRLRKIVNSTLLIKGSRAMALERTLEFI